MPGAAVAALTMISIIICSVDEARFQRVSQTYARVFRGEEFEVVGIHDARGLAEGYNRGIKSSRGEIVILSHDDIDVINDDFKDRLLGHLGAADLLGVAGATRVRKGAWIAAGPPYIYGQIAQRDAREKSFMVMIWGTPTRRVEQIKVMDGVFLCGKRQVMEAVPFDEQTFPGFHLYDIDFTFRAHQAGFRLAVCCDLLLIHESFGKFDTQWEHYVRVFGEKYAAQMDPVPERSFQVTAVKVRRREELPEVMIPAQWGP